MAHWVCGAARDLPTSSDDSWDGGAAAAGIFAWAGGGDTFDPAKAKRGFLAYDAANPKLRGSYKLPFARVSNGKLVSSRAGVRAAASRLDATQIPASVKSTARGVIDGYERKMGMGDHANA